MTFKGTNTYVVGDNELAIIDPGPISEVHFANIIKVIANRPVKFVFLTHSHIDHSPLAKRISNELKRWVVMMLMQVRRLLIKLRI